jgi:phage shock protein A
VTWLYVTAGVIVLLALFQRKTLSRIGAAVSAQMGKVGRLLWGFDPVAVYQQQVDNAAEEIKDATTGLEQYRGLVARLQRQVGNGEKEVARLDARIKVYITSGDDTSATNYAIQLKKTTTELEENKAQLAQYQSAYENNLKKIRFANQRIADAREKAQKLSADLKLSKAEAETAKLAQKFNCKNVSLDGVAEVEDEIQRQIDSNRAKAQVISDLSEDGLADIAEQEAVQKQEAAGILAEYKAKMNQQPSPAPTRSA